jgi:hypothetical protein
MNDMAKRILADRMRRGDRRSGDYEERRSRDHGVHESDYGEDYRGRMEYRGEVEHDGRRGGYNTGIDHGEDYRGDMRGDYRGDMRGDYRRDYGEEVKLSRSDMKRWKKMLKNGDGTTGEHFTADQMREVSHQIGARYDEYDDMDLCMTANMLYSDLCEALRPLVPKEKEAMVYAKMAKAWLEDDDGPEGSEKLALYFYCIVDGDE